MDIMEYRGRIEDHALAKAKSSLAWWRDKEAIYDYENDDWINLSLEDLHIMELALMSMAEEFTLNLPNPNDIKKVSNEQ